MHQVTGFALLLWGGAILCFIVYGLDSSSPDNLYLGIVLSSVVFMTGVFSFYQEYDAESTMAGFKNLEPDSCKCVRDYANWNGKDCAAGFEDLNFESGNLVRGDVVEVFMGKKVPADILIIAEKDMKVDNSALTGEPDPLSRSNKKNHDDAWETKNIAFYG